MFVFIAGYLFHHLSEKYEYKRYLKKKFLNVLLPYLFLSTPAVYHAIWVGGLEERFLELQDTGVLYKVAWLYLKGGAHLNHPLWFIPMIMLFYLAAPFFIYISKNQKWYLLLLILLVHRPEYPNLDVVHSFLSFLPVYILGMFFSQFRVELDAYVKDNFIWLVLIFLMILFYQIFFMEYHGVHTSVSMFSTERGVIDILLLQKLILSILLLHLLKIFDRIVENRLDYIAQISFGIFFVHGYFLFILSYFFHEVIQFSLINWFILTTLVVFLSIATCYLGQKFLNKKSRLVIGC